jgi:transcriptional regulator with XRE-family HTH domain
LADEAGLHPTYVSRIETGKGNVSVTKLLSLARALGTSASDLLSGIPE